MMTKKNIFLSVILSLSFIFLGYTALKQNKLEKCWDNIDFKKTEQLLLESKVKEKIPLQEYSGLPKSLRQKLKKNEIYHPNESTFVLVFDNGLRAIYKPNRYKDKIQHALDYYYLSTLMGFNLVPPTVMRSFGKEDSGIVQLFIDNHFENKKYLLSRLTAQQKSNLYIFYFLVGEIDYGGKNMLISKNCKKPVPVDGDLRPISQIQYGDYPFTHRPIKGLKTPPLSVKDFTKFPFNKVQSATNINELVGLKSIPIDYKNLVHELKDKKIYYIKWKNAYWIKRDWKYGAYMLEGVKPKFLTKKMKSNLKKLNRKKLEKLFSNQSKKYNLSRDSWYTQSYISSILHRRDVLLKK